MTLICNMAFWSSGLGTSIEDGCRGVYETHQRPGLDEHRRRRLFQTSVRWTATATTYPRHPRAALTSRNSASLFVGTTGRATSRMTAGAAGPRAPPPTRIGYSIVSTVKPQLSSARARRGVCTPKMADPSTTYWGRRRG